MLTIQEASAVNVLADFLLNRRTAADELRTPDEATEALRTLARGAHKKLMAGIKETDVGYIPVARQGVDCTCDDEHGCAVCFAEAEEYIGKLIRSEQGHIWRVRSTGEKDGFPTLSGGGYWTRPDDVTVVADDAESACQNCNWTGPNSALREIRDIGQRVDPGEPMPTGECPECDALCQPIPEDA